MRIFLILRMRPPKRSHDNTGFPGNENDDPKYSHDGTGVPGNSKHCMTTGVPENVSLVALRSVCMPNLNMSSTILSKDR